MKEHFQAFLPPDTEGNDLGRKALRAFETSDAPVRWWHVTQTINVDTGQAIVLGKEVTVRSSGRLRNSVREDMSHVVIVLDTSRIGTVSIASLADYISMIALAQFGLTPADVIRELARREGLSGLQEFAERPENRGG